MRLRNLRAATVALAALLPSCGGGGGGGGSGGPTTVVVGSDAALDGSVTTSALVDTAGADSLVGDLDGIQAGRVHRTFFSFSLAGIPANATVDAATLTAFQTFLDGNPYSVAQGSIVVDHLDFGATLGPGAFGQVAITPALATLSSDLMLSAKSVSVRTAVQADLVAGRVRSQFRLRFAGTESDGDGVNDVAFWGTAREADPARRPALTVTYRVP